jgi:predicted alpha/beta superfamily hydrolase
MVFQSTAQVTFIIQQIPSNTPPGDTLFIAGNFNAWNPGNSAGALVHAGQGTYLITLPVQGNIQYKYTRGSWSSVEGNATGSFRPNRSKAVQAGDTLRDTVLSWEDLGSAGGQSTALPNVSRISGFYMPQLNRTRSVWVYLPGDYHTTQKNYPVLYLQDGQNVFDQYTSFAGEWGVDETLHALEQDSGDYGCIVVAIDNSSQRIQEYTPWRHPQYGGGDGDLYVQFIQQNLKPWIDSVYRTMPGAEHTAIGGSSLGGLLAFYAQQSYPQTFGKALVFSPSYWFNDSVYRLPAQSPMPQSGRIFQLAGQLEGNGSVVLAVNRMQDSLLANYLPPTALKTVIKADGQHSEWFWRREFGAAYRWLFKDLSLEVAEALPAEDTFLYPNPVDDYIIVQGVHHADIMNIDVTGKEYSEGIKKSVFDDSDKNMRISGLSRLPAGVYWLVITTGGQREIYQFTKQP